MFLVFSHKKHTPLIFEVRSKARGYLSYWKGSDYANIQSTDSGACGLCVSIAAKSRDKLLTVLAVALFVVCGGEHCITDWFYVCAAIDYNDLDALRLLGLAIVGNTLGGLWLSILESCHTSYG